MKKKVFSVVILPVIVAFAVIWIHLGSLVNFHQNRIWHKHLIPRVIGSIKEKEKYKTLPLFQKNKPGHYHNSPEFLPFSSMEAGQNCAHFASEFSCCILLPPPVIITFISPTPSGLRAPPPG
ncbi:MAG: hypothetical protein NTU44_08190 [Bacteroidetes bacterium]|nr:hypothetical protein [Bacteroidota bacterium]